MAKSKPPGKPEPINMMLAAGTAVLLVVLVRGTGLWGLLWWLSPLLACFVAAIWTLVIIAMGMGTMPPPPPARPSQRASQPSTKTRAVAPGSICQIKHGRSEIARPTSLAHLEEWDRLEIDATEEFDALDRLELMLDSGRAIMISDQCRVRVIRRIDPKDVPELPGAAVYCEVLLLDTKQVALVEAPLLVPA